MPAGNGRTSSLRAALDTVGSAHDPAELPRLLLSIRDIFAAKKVERLTTTELCDALNKEEEGGWSQINHGRGVDAYWLREILSDVVPNDPSLGKETALERRRQEEARLHPRAF